MSGSTYCFPTESYKINAEPNKSFPNGGNMNEVTKHNLSFWIPSDQAGNNKVTPTILFIYYSF